MENSIYSKIYNLGNLIIAWRKARKHKTKKDYVREFEQDTLENLFTLQKELKDETYQPEPLKTFILRDPKTRKISKSVFIDRIVHHALIGVIEQIFDKGFIYDSCANRVGKGNLFSLKRFDSFKRKVTKNNKKLAFCLKADIKHYFQEVNHSFLLEIISRKIKDKQIICLIKKIIKNGQVRDGIGMPLGNLTSQFFANVYLNELDHFVKHILKAKYYIRYVDDFVILYKDKEWLEEWKNKIDKFLKESLRLKLHPQKSNIVLVSQGIDFVGFRNFSHHRLLRKRNVRKILSKVNLYRNGEISKQEILDSFQGWNAYAKWANSYKLRKNVIKKICNPIITNLPM